jgi:hypothetical protein
LFCPFPCIPRCYIPYIADFSQKIKKRHGLIPPLPSKIQRPQKRAEDELKAHTKTPAKAEPFPTVLNIEEEETPISEREEEKTPAMAGRRGRGRPRMEDKLMDEVIRLFEPMGFAVADIRSTVQQLIEVPLPSPFFHYPQASLSHPHPSVFLLGSRTALRGPRFGIFLGTSMQREAM